MSKTLDLSKMSRSEARVALMRDVLAHLDALKVGSGFYVRFPHENNYREGQPVQEIVDVLQKECQVCLLGGMFLSFARLFNQVEIRQSWLDKNGRVYPGVVRSGVTRSLSELFTEDELNTFETIFECGYTYSSRDIGDEMITRLRINDLSLRDRIRLVAEHVVRHDGMFDLGLLAIERSK